jgi:hypothetical protein
MKQRTTFLWYFLGHAGPSTELFFAFVSGLLVMNVFGNLIYNLLAEPRLTPAAIGGPVVGCGVLTAAAFALYRRHQRRESMMTLGVQVGETSEVPAHAGLIWLFGPGNFGHLLFALQGHHDHDGAQHCWLVMQNLESVENNYQQLDDELKRRQWNVQLHPERIQHLDALSAYRAVHDIYSRRAREVGLKPEQVIADITGGVKPVTAGMVLAALTMDCKMEYVESDRDAQGDYIPGTQHLMLVDTEFYVTRKE